MAERKPYTPWHPLFVAIMKYAYRQRCTVHGEYLLSQWPLRADVLLIEKEVGAGPLLSLPAIGRNLGRRYTLLELKGPTDELERLDLPLLISYAGLLEVHEQVADPADIHLMVVASSIPPCFRGRVEQAGGHLVQRDRGLYLVDGLMYPLYCIEAAPASEVPGNGLLYAFSREHLREPRRLRARMTADERDLYAELCQHIQQMKQSERIMEMKDAELFTKTADEILREVVAAMPPEDRLRDLPPEDRLRGLPPEDRLRGLPPEDRLAGLSPEELDQLLAVLVQRRQRH